MKWEKLGLVFCPSGDVPWMRTHAANPFALPIKDSLYRIYFTCRNAAQQSHISYVDIDMEDGFAIRRVADRPLLEPGAAGLFDDSGVAVGYVLPVGDELFLYYLGWNLKVTVPWLNTIGLARYNPQTQTFDKCSKAPLLDRSHEDPYSISYPCILRDGNRYRMWYGSNLGWGANEKDMLHVIKYAESDDALTWRRKGRVDVSLNSPNEFALSKPFVVKDPDCYRMWYSYRSTMASYRIGYAESQNAELWYRHDDVVGIDVSDEGWDSEMISYPCIFDYNNKRYMLYNGNGYGKTGFGIALQTV